jgi:hexosaminidase
VSHTWSERVDEHAGTRRSSHKLDLCSEGVGLLLEPSGNRDAPLAGGAARHVDAPLAIDIMNPCWLYRDVELERGARLLAAVSALPFNFELGADTGKIRVGDNRTPQGELEVHVDGCETMPVGILPLTPASTHEDTTVLPALALPPLPGRHDVCLRFARPSLDPLWALDWIEIGD